ncbi:trichohyalin-like [Ptychodera flava]|uniref:trichohyalin-like n=1 Tax=Ptychodera flava TaxID=63121 RepID=UPI003969EDD0
MPLKFDAGTPRAKQRYEILHRPGSSNGKEEDEDKATKEYAAFLREQERKCGPNGYLDSTRYTYSYQLKGKVVDSKGNKAGDGGSSGSSSAPAVLRKQDTPSVVELQSKIEKGKKDYEKRIKVIEDHMWQHKQEERELKRAEGDVIKNQQHLRRTMREYEQAINKKRMAEEKKLSETRQREFEIQRDYTHKKEENTKSRIEKVHAKNQQRKDEVRKSELQSGDLERNYKRTLTEIELRRKEVERLNDEFSQKMKQKEEETFRLKKELAELALALNMETAKRRTMEVDNKKDTKKDSIDRVKDANDMETGLEKRFRENQDRANNFEMNRRRLSADLTLSKAHISQKAREEGRHLQDTQNRLVDNTHTQRQLQEAALNVELDLKSKQIDQRIQAHDIKRHQKVSLLTKQRRQKHEQQLESYMERLAKRQHDAERRQHEDKLKHCVRTVNKQEELEQDLYNKVRQAEYSRKQKEQLCKRLSSKLDELKRQNSVKMKEMAVTCLSQEKDVEQSLQRAQADLYKFHVNREESYLSLQQHRVRMREDKYRLEETEREHRRLSRIGELTDMTPSYS